MNERGGVLIFVLWVVMFLTVMALSLGQRSRVGLAFVNGHVQSARAKAAAWAGVVDVLEKIHGSRDQADTLYECGVDIPDDKNIKTEFHGDLEEATFDLFYTQDGRVWNGVQDEERKINLNALDEHNERILFYLAQLSGVHEDAANRLTRAVLTKLDRGRAFETVDELLLLPGISKEVYLRIKDDVTIYPRMPASLAVNLNTASLNVVKA